MEHRSTLFSKSISYCNSYFIPIIIVRSNVNTCSFYGFYQLLKFLQTVSIYARCANCVNCVFCVKRIIYARCANCVFCVKGIIYARCARCANCGNCGKGMISARCGNCGNCVFCVNGCGGSVLWNARRAITRCSFFRYPKNSSYLAAGSVCTYVVHA